MKKTPSREDERKLHQKVIQRNDPADCPDVFSMFMKESRIRALMRDTTCDEATAHDAMTDVLLEYIGNPRRYDPSRASLTNYLNGAFKHRVTDMLRREAKRARVEEKGAAIVELRSRPPNEVMEVRMEANRAMDRIEKAGLLDDPRDKTALLLILTGEGSTEVLARALELPPSSDEEQRKVVKRNRDRLMKMLKRSAKEEDPDDES